MTLTQDFKHHVVTAKSPPPTRYKGERPVLYERQVLWLNMFLDFPNLDQGGLGTGWGQCSMNKIMEYGMPHGQEKAKPEFEDVLTLP